ncbi:MAG: hypothetical protein K0S12_941, partial [Bacteroidetes bacterium]|nr:hypothetical protein [Bacteroidota bacterium]
MYKSGFYSPLLAVTLTLSLHSFSQKGFYYPKTEKEVVTDDYFGRKV